LLRSQRGVVWPYLLLGVALFGALSFGVFQTRQKNQLALDSENKYLSAFHKLKFTSENIEERTARIMATNDPQLMQSLLSDLRVYSAQAVEHMSVLPFTNLRTPRIESFLSTLRDKSDEYHAKLADGQPLSQQDWAQLMELRRQATHFESELGNLLGLVGNNMIRWGATARVTGPLQSGDTPTPITRGVLQIDQGLQGPPGEEAALTPDAGPLARPRTDWGPRVDAATAVAAVRKFVDMPLQADPVVTGQSDPEDRLRMFSLYFISAQKANGVPLSFGVSIHGGHVVYMIDGRTVTQRNFTTDQMVARGREWLKRWGYPEVEYISAIDNDATLVMDFAPIQDGVAIHTERIKVMLAMDNAEVVGFDARNFWTNRHTRAMPIAKLNKAEAKRRVAPRLQVQGEPRLALIADRRSKERLAWEFRGRVDDQSYIVFVDALSGVEVDVQRLGGDPAAPYNVPGS